MNAIIVFLKYPEPGKVKTRLGKQIGYGSAADLYRLFIKKSFHSLQRLVDVRLFAAVDPPDKLQAFQSLLPANVERFAQHGGDLGERMYRAFSTVFAAGFEKVVTVGTDSPTLPPDFIMEAFENLAMHELVLGPAEDGGYYLIALRNPHPKLFENIPWSSEQVFSRTLQHAQSLRLSYHLLPKWYDVDDVASLRRAANDDDSGELRRYLECHPEISEANQ